MDEIEVFRKYVRKSGLRNTPEREIIIKEIFSTHDHFDVDTLYLRLKNKRCSISKASIYRTIPLLMASGLIKEAFYENGIVRYEHVYGHEDHCHFRCLGCGRDGSLLCPDCCQSLPRIKQPYCQRCGTPLTGGNLCPACISYPPSIEGIRSVFLFGGTVRQAIHQFKYRNIKAMAAPLGQLLTDYLHTYPLPGDVFQS